MKNILFLFVVFSIISCEKTFKSHTNSEKQVNVMCFLEADDTIRVNLSYTFDLNRTNLDDVFINNAQILLFENDKLIGNIQKANLKPQEGWYFSSYTPKEGNKYKLKIIVPLYDTIYSETDIPTSTKIEYLSNNISIYDSIAQAYLMNVFLCFTDPKNNDNYYYIFSNQPYFSNDPAIETRGEDGFYTNNETYLYDFNVPIFSDSLFKDQNYTLNLSNIFSLYSDTIIFTYELATISYDAYLFYKTVFLKTKTNNNPLVEPVIIYSNVTNGTGIFAGLSSNKDTIIFIKNQ
ncbi:MAG: DUF4249 domain-containing protein [Bacteroidales bacterium]|nr:DUF4249 domain-containing protein [Bacteroidales bacterium]